MTVELGDPIVVAQADRADYPWGVWQSPMILRVRSEILISYHTFIDSSTLHTVKQMTAAVVLSSRDGGHTWQPSSAEPPYRGTCTRRNGELYYLRFEAREIPKSVLPEPSGRRGRFLAYDPLQIPAGLDSWHLVRLRPDSDRWERIPVTIDDPDAALWSYEPPGKAHVMARSWRGNFHDVELPDGSLLAVCYGGRLGPDRTPRPKTECYCLRSIDDGMTWTFHGIIARDDDHPVDGFTETAPIVLADGSLLAVLRTQEGEPTPMYQTRSVDGGRTWGEPSEVFPFGVLPRMVLLGNGVLALSFGRPGVHLAFSPDGTGNPWEELRTLVVESFAGSRIDAGRFGDQAENPEGKGLRQRTMGYTGLLATGDDSFIIAYDQFDYPDPSGKPCKTILVRHVRVHV